MPEYGFGISRLECLLIPLDCARARISIGDIRIDNGNPRRPSKEMDLREMTYAFIDERPQQQEA
jgi:hypothetical protein